MHEWIVIATFPDVKLPVVGYKCPQCGEETIRAQEASATQKLARMLGLWKADDLRVRRALKIGNSVGLTLDPAQARALGIKPGISLEVERHGDHIIVRRAKG